ncbi:MULTISPECIES: AraC family transcriptional regulator ligand-binding domain-containing protein [unclassified Alteromonas]|uniref:AraC family transcriptional regulator ligand-binding domain-containing protein n=1 Tax=unclassified Alteromonas TaxID=2614992 RepID=UPI0016535120|nr:MULTISPECIES: AraC family transcriptional regulator ligand-binding domain-containing protein [unclassified Alteromonas]MBC6987849.1 AraC family transcriptional regulator ligand-binding domain-containing protein [Alteromonas sp. BZK5]MCG7643928.1 AraC family transcriptional regulator [Alteromonas sp. MmMcT2-2]MCG7651855.1 AraC family transcriptional regulator [Alteromonas sp. MmMcT2-5]
MEESYTVLSGWMISIKRAMELFDLDFDEACQNFKIDSRAFNNPESRTTAKNITKILNYTNAKLNRHDFSISVANQFHPNIFHALGYAMVSSESLQAALQCLANYKRVLSNTCKLTALERNSQLLVHMNLFCHKSTASPVLSYVGVELFILTVIKFSRELAGANIVPLKVLFSFPEPNHDTDYLNDYFKCDVVFNAEKTTIVFDLEQTQKQLITTNSLITQMHEKILEEFMSRIDKNDLKHVVKSKIFDLLPFGSPSQQVIAESLGFSLRNMQRKLNEQGTNYQSLLEKTRKESRIQLRSATLVNIKQPMPFL